MAFYSYAGCFVRSKYLLEFSPSGKTLSAKNPFVETTLTYVLTFIHRRLRLESHQSLSPTRLTILADNDYYSNSHEETPKVGLGRFAKFPYPIREAPKTGLGSSAALVTALTGALLTHYLPGAFDISSPEGKRTLHNLAQVAHGAAQGKIGSGFDIAAAVYGACNYRRFSPSILSSLPEPGKPGFSVALEDVVLREWDGSIDDFTLPAGLAIRMVDVHSGTQTVSMVKKVLEWRSKNPVRATEIWWSLHGLNLFLEQQLRAKDGNLEHLAETISRCRALIRTMSEESGVPIEPPQQTALLDKLTAVEGVYGGVVPGAGGFDAAAIVAKDDEETLKRIRKCCEDARTPDYQVDLMRVKCASEGARTEHLRDFDGWLNV